MQKSHSGEEQKVVHASAPEDNRLTPQEQPEEWRRIQQDVGDLLRHHLNGVVRQALPTELAELLQGLAETTIEGGGGHGRRKSTG